MLKEPVSTNDHFQGTLKAPLILVEYGDFQCPFCREAHYVVKHLQKEFGPDLLYVFRNFPLTNIHPNAEMAAEAAECANTYNHYWEMHDAIYDNQPELSPEMLLEQGLALGIPIIEMKKAILQHSFENRIKQDFMSGVRSGVNGTPTFFINGQRHNGPHTVESLSEALNSILL